jgi:GSH-dependent disulfide-bond oxidoreductase
MITLYTWCTPNGFKASIMLETIGIDYDVHPINIGKDQQFAPEFLEISPNNKIPALVDEENGVSHTLFESGAILLYLAEKYDCILPAAAPRREQALEWLLWASSGLGPMLGQWNTFARRNELKNPEAIAHFTKEAVRLLKVLERRLNRAGYLAEEYSIADIAAFTWPRAMLEHVRAFPDSNLGATPAIDAWLLEIGKRPPVVRGLNVPKV